MEPTPLHTYLKARGINDSKFAARIGRDRSLISRLRRGLVRPTLDIAVAIERETKGAVPIKGWLPRAVS